MIPSFDFLRRIRAAKINPSKIAVVVALACAALIAPRTWADDVTWTNAAGNSTWDTISANWSTGVWNNANGDGAIFDSSVLNGLTVSAPITVRSIDFGVYYQLSGTGSLTITSAGTSTLGVGQISVDSNVATTIAVPINSAYGLTKLGAGQLSIGGTNNISGTVAVNNGSLTLGSAGALGASVSGVTVASGATLVLDTTVSISSPITISGTGDPNAPLSMYASGAILNLAGNSTISGPITLASNAQISSFSINNPGATLTLSGGFNGPGVPSFQVVATSTIVLTGPALNIGTQPLNVYGVSTLANGVLVLPNMANVLGNLNVAGIASVRISADNNLGASSNQINLNVGFLQLGAAFNLDPARLITIQGTAGIDTQGFNTTYSGNITGSGTFTKLGTGTLTLNSQPNYTGGTAIGLSGFGPGGTLKLGLDNALPVGGPLTIAPVANNSTLDLNGKTQQIGSLTVYAAESSTNPSTVITDSAGGGVLILGGDVANAVSTSASYMNGPAVVAATVDLGGATRTFSITHGPGAGGGLVFDGPITGTGGITQTGGGVGTVPGTLTLGAANTYNGPTTLNAGGLFLGADNAIPSTSAFIQSAGTTLYLFAFGSPNLVSTGLGSLTGAGSIIFGSSSSVLTVGGDNTSPAAYAGVISGSGGSLTKVGTGTMTLSGANTYSGNTTITGGTLALTGNGSIANSPVIIVGTSSGPTLDVSGVSGGANFNAATGSFTLASGQVLQGFGTVVGNVLVPSGAGVSPGASIGTLSFTGNLVIDGTYSAEVANPPAADDLAITGSLSLTGNSTLDLLLSNTLDGTTPLTLATYQGPIGGLGQFATVENLPAGYEVVYPFDPSSNSGSIVLEPVPEPGALMLTALAGAAAIGWRWRRRRASPAMLTA